MQMFSTLCNTVYIVHSAYYCILYYEYCTVYGYRMCSPVHEYKRETRTAARACKGAGTRTPVYSTVQYSTLYRLYISDLMIDSD